MVPHNFEISYVTVHRRIDAICIVDHMHLTFTAEIKKNYTIVGILFEKVSIKSRLG